MYRFRLNPTDPKRPKRRFRRIYGLTHHRARKQWALLLRITEKYPSLLAALEDD